MFMLSKKSILIICFATLLALFVFSANKFTGDVIHAQSSSSLQVSLYSETSSYALGEPVAFNFEVKSNSASDIWVKGLDLESNYLRLFISSDGINFKQYRHSRIKERPPRLFRPGQIATSRSEVLWNFSPKETSTTWKKMEKTHILEYFAFPEPGTYIVKAVLSIPGKDGSMRIESNSIKLTITPLVGDDLEVWRIIKSKPDIAYFIQESSIRIPEYKTEARAKFQQDVEAVVFQHPNSRITKRLNQSLEKLKRSEAAKKEFLEKIKQQSKNK